MSDMDQSINMLVNHVRENKHCKQCRVKEPCPIVACFPFLNGKEHQPQMCLCQAFEKYYNEFRPEDEIMGRSERETMEIVIIQIFYKFRIPIETIPRDDMEEMPIVTIPIASVVKVIDTPVLSTEYLANPTELIALRSTMESPKRNIDNLLESPRPTKRPRSLSESNTDRTNNISSHNVLYMPCNRSEQELPKCHGPQDEYSEDNHQELVVPFNMHQHLRVPNPALQCAEDSRVHIHTDKDTPKEVVEPYISPLSQKN